MTVRSILIAGGYGVVGEQIARLARARYPEMQILLGGRNPQSGEALAWELGSAAAVYLSTEESDPFKDLNTPPDLVLAVVNDNDDQLLLSCVRRGIPLIDVTRWTERMRSTLQRLTAEEPLRAPVVLSSSWMAGIIATLAAGYARELSEVDRIDIGILYSQNDRAGPNSVEYMDRMHLPFEVTENGERAIARPFRRAFKTDFPDTGTFKLYRFDSPDQFTLPTITGAGTVTARIGFDDGVSGPMLSAMVRTGLWNLISGEAMTRLRRGLLFNPGEGAPHRVRIDINGRDEHGTPVSRSWLTTDPEGQTHMTAVGAIIQLDRLISAGSFADNAGVQIAEAVTDLHRCLEILEENGIEVAEVR